MEERWQGTVTINRPVEEVYRYLADFPRHCEWAQTLESMELKQAGDSSGVGARYLTSERQALQSDRKPHERIANGMRAKTMCEVRELVPNRRIAWRANPHPVKLGVSANIAMELEPAGDGRIRLTQTIAMRQPKLMMSFAKRFMGMTEEKVKAQWQASLDNIKLILEEGSTPPIGSVAASSVG